jgi:hypothetical protein
VKKDLRRLVRDLVAQGVTKGTTTKGHVALKRDGVTVAVLGGTPSDRRSATTRSRSSAARDSSPPPNSRRTARQDRNMTKTTRKKAVAASIALLLAAMATGCSAATGQTGDLEKLAETCPANGVTLDAYVGYDVSGTGRQTDITMARDAALTDIATNVAVCGGHLHVDAFAGSAAASRVVFDGDLKPAGATQIAQLRQVPDLVKSTMQAIEAGISTATKSLSPDGSDITSQFGMAAEFGNQISANGKHRLKVDILTDGVQTVGVVLNTGTLTAATATDLAKTAPVVELPAGTAVKISGLGKIAGAAAPTSYVQAIQAFYLTYCHRTGAAACAAVVDYTAGS